MFFREGKVGGIGLAAQPRGFLEFAWTTTVLGLSIKLFTEKYLGGRVRFESKEPVGTTFQVMLPYPSFTGVL